MFKKSLKEVIEKNCESILSYEGVQAIGEGEGFKDGKPKGECLVFFVEKKKPLYTLQKAEVLPKKYRGYKCDVIEVGTIEPMNVHRQRVRPVIGGTSGKVESGSACSIGLIVFKDGKKHALTNEHCVHFQGDRTGQRFLQPSPSDKGTATDTIGTITAPPIIRNDQQNKIDSHIIPLDVDSQLKVQGLTDYKKQWAKPKVGTRFTKIGRTTGITEGVISHINAVAKVNMRGSLGVCEFYPCFFALQSNFNIVNGGDSGSCCFSNEGVLGQTFAASKNLAIFLTGEVVGQELGITLEEPRIGFIAVDTRWLAINETNITTRRSVNLRSKPTTTAEIIKVLPRGTRLKVIDTAGVSDNHIWGKVA